MNSNPSSPGDAAEAPASFKPYVADETEMTESTIGAIVLGSLLGIVFAAASVYAGLKIGLTTSASIPIAVLSITILRAFGKSTILKNNIVQTTGSAGESLAAGVAFTLPSLLLMGFEMDALRITLIALLGGILGTLMMIPLRQGLIVKEHGRLPFPEGTACAQVLIVGEKGGSGAKSLFAGLFLGGLWAYLMKIGKLFAEVPQWVLSNVQWGGKSYSLFKGGSISFETNPVLLGTGYIIGARTSFIMLAGGLLSFLVLIPAIQFFGPGLTSPLVRDNDGALIPAGAMSPGDVRNAFVLYIGAGAVAAGGLISLARALPTILGAFARGLGGIVGRGGSAVRRTERDLPMGVVVLGCIILVLAIWAPNLAYTKGVLVERDILGINWLSAILIVVFGFFFTTVSARITGEIGSSSNPISGMTVATLLITCLLFVAAGWTGISYKEMALCTAALVCVAASNGGATSQVLKTGHLLGATPRSQQIAISMGVITSAAVIGFTLMFLNQTYTSYHAFQAPGFDPAAVDARLEAEGRGAELEIRRGSKEFRGQSWDALYVRTDQRGANDPERIVVPRGTYLLDAAGAIALREDPGVCGRETKQLAADGVTVERDIGQKLDAPKARLFQLIIDGVLERTLPWELVLIGVFVAIMMELCGVPSLAFAVGVYLPISTSASIFIGGLMRKWADRRNKMTPEQQESSPGVLFSSGLIAGGALVAILACGLIAPKRVEQPDGSIKDTTWGENIRFGDSEPIDLNLAHKVVGPDETVRDALHRYGVDVKPVLAICDESSLAMNARQFMEQHNWWGLGCFGVLALILLLVAARRPRTPA